MAVARALLALGLLTCARSTTHGAVKLDNYTFDKALTLKGMNWLVKVDKNYAYGDAEDAFTELCKLVHPVKDLLVATIPVSEYGDKDNDDLREKFGVSADEMPAFFLLKKGSFEEKLRFQGFADPRAKRPSDWDDDEDGEWEPPMLKEITTENLNLWLRKNGLKTPSIGTIFEFDELVQSFMKSGPKDADIQSAKKLAAEDFSTDSKAAVYIRIMEKIQAKGVSYVETEMARVKKVLTGKVTPEKEAELKDKVKILSVFADATAS
eukprot:TRINITY_DN95255_c0_g1_i1.p1 TRINITY_DN95255_c0_g1~~TRINITY_DN95255_c0_g1_i1.p1  ORF type:complete len:265 (-),score=84.58 TRINITY_DN95255_c0_g1_i1:73-867(-)